MIQGYHRIRQLTESARARTTGRIMVSLITIWRERSILTVVLVNKVTFDVIQLVNVSNIAYDSSTEFYTITGTPTSGTYNAKTYNLQIIW